MLGLDVVQADDRVLQDRFELECRHEAAQWHRERGGVGDADDVVLELGGDRRERGLAAGALGPRDPQGFAVEHRRQMRAERVDQGRTGALADRHVAQLAGGTTDLDRHPRLGLRRNPGDEVLDHPVRHGCSTNQQRGARNPQDLDQPARHEHGIGRERTERLDGIEAECLEDRDDGIDREATGRRIAGQVLERLIGLAIERGRREQAQRRDLELRELGADRDVRDRGVVGDVVQRERFLGCRSGLVGARNSDDDLDYSFKAEHERTLTIWRGYL